MEKEKKEILEIMENEFAKHTPGFKKYRDHIKEHPNIVEIIKSNTIAVFTHNRSSITC